jgi:sirohydrochlorin cobaltochelatase
MEQDQFFRRDKSLMSDSCIGGSSVGLLIAAHGERRPGACNDSVTRLAAAIPACSPLREVTIGFIKGVPTIAQGVRALGTSEIIVYPLFLSAGYFTRVRLPRLLEDAQEADMSRSIHILPPLGVDPSFGALIIERLLATALGHRMPPELTNVVLLAHGSTGDPASRGAAEQVAAQVRQRLIFRSVRIALLEEPPFLADAVGYASGPLLVFGLFAGEGMHGAGDAPNLVAALNRAGAVFAGTITGLPGIADLIAAAVARVLAAKRERTPRDAGLGKSTQQAPPLRRETTAVFS